MKVVPLPAVLRRVPSFANEGEPELSTNALPSPTRSRVALGLLLKRAVLNTTWPLVHVAVPLFTRVPPPIVLEKPPLIARPPLAETTKVDPTLPKFPAVQA